MFVPRHVCLEDRKTFVRPPTPHPTCEQLLIVCGGDMKAVGARSVSTSRGCERTPPSDDLACERKVPDSLSLSVHVLLFLSPLPHPCPPHPTSLAGQTSPPLRSASTTCLPFLPLLLVLAFCFPLSLPLCLAFAPLSFRVVPQTSPHLLTLHSAVTLLN